MREGKEIYLLVSPTTYIAKTYLYKVVNQIYTFKKIFSFCYIIKKKGIREGEIYVFYLLFTF
jgi:hypothetical protein